MTIKRMAILSVHASPLARLGGFKTGGMNVYVRELASELGARGIKVDIFTRFSAINQKKIDYSLGENVRVIHALAGPKQPLSPEDVYVHLQQFTAEIIAFTTQENVHYDILYSHYWLSGWVAQQLKELWRTPFVQMFHTLGHMKNRIAGSDPPRYYADARINTEMKIVRWADQLIAATPAEMAQLRWLYRADRRKITVAPPGVNTSLFHPIATEQAKERINVSPEERLLLFVGRIEPLKAVDTILDALHYIQVHQPLLLEHTRLIVIGGEPEDRELQRLQRMAAELNLAQIVDFVGARDQSQLPDYYAAATAVIMPSDYESFGLVALEAMASGTPVIASQVGGLAFLVHEGETGFLVPVRDPVTLAQRIAALLADPARAQRMGEAAARVAADYSWSAITDRLLPLFEQLADNRLLSRRKR
jgi:D-inositol-3-phosphate glycosyltransferase